MPLLELEQHPYLASQVDDFTDRMKLSKYFSLIVGTFPIYALTTSTPVENDGYEKRENWLLHAFIQYYYGSLGSSFWNLFSNAFNEEMPTTQGEAIALLDKYGFLITDVFKNACRKGYSPLDNDLINTELNHTIYEIIENSNNLKTIYFTSKTAKKRFCSILGIRFLNEMHSFENILNRNYQLIVLPSPAGNGRTVRFFFDSFPLLKEERDKKLSGLSYALDYRERYYSHYLPNFEI